MFTKIVTARSRINFSNSVRFIQGSGNPGSGAGRGGGGGSVRQSGVLGEYGVAQEEGYFYKKQTELLKKIKERLKSQPQKAKGTERKPEPKHDFVAV